MTNVNKIRARVASTLTLGMLMAVLLADRATADPTGSPSRIDQQVTLHIARDRVEVRYAVTLNRPAAFLEILAMDANGDGEMTADEQQAYFAGVAETIRAGLEISIDGRELPLEPIGEIQLEMPFTKRLTFAAPIALGDREAAWIEFHNDTHLADDGDVSLAIETAPGVAIDYRSLAESGVAPNSAFKPRGSLTAQQRDAGFVCRDANLPAVAGSGLAGGRTSVGKSTYENAAASVSADTHETFYAAIGVAMLCGVFFLVALGRNSRAVRVAIAPTLIVVAVVGCQVFAARRATLASAHTQQQREQVFARLHSNVYEAFEAKTENDLFATLAESFDGQLLEENYLRIAGLVFPDRAAGTSFRVRRVKPLESRVVETAEAGDGTFRIRHRWQVWAVVSHFGHRHARTNQYEATFSVAAGENGWRITAVDLNDCQRADGGLLFASTSLP